MLRSTECASGAKSPDRTIELRTIDIETFDIFVKWLRISTEDSDDTAALPAVASEQSRKRLMPLVKAHIFGVRFEIPKLSKDAIVQLAVYMRQYLAQPESGDYTVRLVYLIGFASEAITHVYTRVEPLSTLRAFFVDCFCAANVETSVTNWSLVKYPKEFLVDVMIQRATLVGFEEGVVEATQRMETWQRYGGLTGKKRKAPDDD